MKMKSLAAHHVKILSKIPICLIFALVNPKCLAGNRSIVLKRIIYD